VGPRASTKVCSTVTSLSLAGNGQTIPRLSCRTLDAVRNELPISTVYRPGTEHCTVDVWTSYRISCWPILWQSHWLRLHIEGRMSRTVKNNPRTFGQQRSRHGRCNIPPAACAIHS